ncbi:thiopeptide-type bacteriocin biosynthesis domain-containing protein [Algoriphagus faecimaris]|uniref:Thiopeptide-type bacteriocin biosynthesis domain-containing protein n=1 Tax=Algoriphagus faecimaris TaxID=686796 RepID=A0A1G6UW39_9BACT|nr:lantibiotic dehydratase [Algoriphagus faecimaris]SDD44867.1 thiopeptide-type bacteriocin biosynthesis domain-containing protein [Algoriphagus faecimaris]
MDFIYRSPLFDFNIYSDEEIEKNWNSIFAAILNASPSLAAQLVGKKPAELENKVRRKLQKYLIRGRFRPTPFGYFAGVGLGVWSDDTCIDRKSSKRSVESSRTIPCTEKQLLIDEFFFTEEVALRHGYFSAITYSPQSRWQEVKVKYHPVLDHIIQRFKGTRLNFQTFDKDLRKIDPNFSSEDSILLWTKINDLGWVYPTENKPLILENGVDVFLCDKFQLDKEIEKKLRGFIEQAGNLFVFEKSQYLTSFTQWFGNQFDDRFLCLSELTKNPAFLGNSFFQKQTESNDKHPFSFQSESFDLKGFHGIQKLEKEIHDVQILFRLDKSNQPIVENLVINRPFVYTGRFSKISEIREYTKKIRDQIFVDQNKIYAHLEILESPEINYISDTTPLLNWKISPFLSTDQNALSFGDLWIGQGNDRILLFHKKSGKEVVPVIFHPLNVEQITHPTLRLIWEIAHQRRYRFRYYDENLLKGQVKLPELKWGDLCLQSKRWFLKWDTSMELSSLKSILFELKIPPIILAGLMDKELLLDLRMTTDLEILWEELRTKGEIILTEAKWYDEDHPRGNSTPYPQFVFRYSREKVEKDNRDYLNPIFFAAQDAVYFLLRIAPLDLEGVLNDFGDYMIRSPFGGHYSRWYFIVYSKKSHLELRIRFLGIPNHLHHRLLSWFYNFAKNRNLNWSLGNYYPEISKYGKKGYSISEQLFGMESVFLLGQKNSNSFILEDAKSKENLIVGIWTDILKRSRFIKAHFSTLKELIYNVDFKEEKLNDWKKRFTILDLNPIPEEFPLEYYRAIFLRHPRFNKSRKKEFNLIINHIHMMCNRFFLLDSAIQEKKIWYGLYRQLGKFLFTKSQNALE